MAHDLSAAQRESIVAEILGGRLIPAIKLYREATGAGLKEARDAVEAMQADLRATSSGHTSDAERQSIETDLLAGRKIAAIKTYREATGAGLKEAKDAVEAMEAELRASSAGRFVAPAGKAGCLPMLLLPLLLVLPAALGVWYLG